MDSWVQSTVPIWLILTPLNVQSWAMLHMLRTGEQYVMAHTVLLPNQEEQSAQAPVEEAANPWHLPVQTHLWHLSELVCCCLTDVSASPAPQSFQMGVAMYSELQSSHVSGLYPESVLLDLYGHNPNLQAAKYSRRRYITYLHAQRDMTYMLHPVGKSDLQMSAWSRGWHCLSWLLS